MRPAKILTLLLILCAFSATPALAANAGWPKALTLGTASPGGVFYVYGQAVAKILTESLQIEVDPLSTQGSEHNVKLIESGEAQLGLLTMGSGLQAWNGTGAWTKGHRYRKMRALFPMYDNVFSFVTLRRSGITTATQFNDRNVCTGPRAGAQGSYVPAILKAIGVSAKIHNGAWDSVSADLLKGSCDALVILAGTPSPILKQLETKEPLVFVSLTPEQIESIRKAMPELSVSQINGGVYTSLDKTYTSVGLFAFAIGRDDLPEELVYQLVKAVFDNQPRLVKATSAAIDTVPQNALKDSFLPFHPGAVRRYRETGISIPEKLIP